MRDSMRLPSSRGRLAGAGALLVASCLAGCKSPPEPSKPIVGLLAAAAPVLLDTPAGPQAITVGSFLRPEARVRATGPAALEYYGGAVRFLRDGDSLEVGEASEAKLLSSNLPQKLLRDRKVIAQSSPPSRLIAAKYADVIFAPSRTDQSPSTGDYLLAFFSPQGLDSLRPPKEPGGPRKLPPLSERTRISRIHAGELGEGGPIARVTRGFAVAEADSLATAVLLEGREVYLGRTTRLLLPRQAQVTLVLPDRSSLELKGPADFRVR